MKKKQKSSHVRAVFSMHFRRIAFSSEIVHFLTLQGGFYNRRRVKRQVVKSDERCFVSNISEVYGRLCSALKWLRLISRGGCTPFVSWQQDAGYASLPQAVHSMWLLKRACRSNKRVSI